ncbi:MAG: nucleotidyl transferase AbiEii/AbiGii toxin family protein [Candidatus Aminicenantes bacterium]|nr:nucleotidyl transferase AbiEii/AbiGii toxin family protein [Candidatus Aminicenantes bacterium]
MAALNFFPEAFAGPDQRKILARLGTHQSIAESFFLTGGTALGVFFLGHRVSDALDLFSRDELDLSEIDFWIGRTWPGETAPIRRSPGFVSTLVRGVKIDLVIDPLAEPGIRERAVLEEGPSIAVDVLENIASNKLAALVGRTELRDYLDHYFITRTYPDLRREDLFRRARKKEALFDDPASAAFQVELAVERLKNRIQEEEAASPGRGLLPGLLKPVDPDDLWRTFGELAEWLYALGKM